MKKLTSVKAMREFLTSHFRYNTMSSWNRPTSFAANVKLYKLDWGGEMPDNAYDFTNTDFGAYYGIDEIVRNFTDKMNGNFTICFNGRSSGYLVLYHSTYKKSDYKSHCDYCGQLNYAIVLPQPKDNKEKLLHYLYSHNHWTPEAYLCETKARSLFPDMPSNEFVTLIKELKKQIPADTSFTYGKCGRCGEEDGLVNLEKPIINLVTYSGRSFGDCLDDEEDIEGMYDIVFEFDKAVEACKKSFVDYVKSHKIDEQEVMEPKMVKVAVPA